MTSSKRHRILALLIYSATFFMLLDTFGLPRSQMTEVLDRGRTETTRTGVTKSYESYILVTKSNNEYLVPETIFNTIDLDSIFLVHKTALFRKPVAVSWCGNGSCYTMATGTLNGHYMSYVAIAYLLIAPMVVLIGRTKIALERRDRMIYVASTMALGTFIFYLVY